MKFPVFITILVLGVIFKIFMSRNNRSSQNPDQQFLEREAAANRVPRKPVDGLPYIKVDPDSLPLDIPTESAETLERQNTIKGMADKKILNLTGISNTDLKFEYGAPNINFLSACDNNYTRLVMNLSRLAEDYINLGHTAEARTLLEYGIDIGTDVKKNYTSLAAFYRDEKSRQKIEALRDKADSLNSLSKKAILDALDAILETMP